MEKPTTESLTYLDLQDACRYIELELGHENFRSLFYSYVANHGWNGMVNYWAWDIPGEPEKKIIDKMKPGVMKDFRLRQYEIARVMKDTFQLGDDIVFRTYP